MKILNLLKNKAGKLVLGGTQIAVLTVGAAGLFSSALFQTGESMGEKELAVRPLSSVSAAAGYEGLNRRSDGMLSSMNIQNRAGNKGVAVGAERERLEGSRSANDFGFSTAENLGSRVSVPAVSDTGPASATSATDGLGSGGVDMVEISAPSMGSGRAPASPGTSAVSVQGAVGGGPAAGGNSGGQLASASMARASGNAFNAASGSMGGGVSAAGGRSGSGARAGAKAKASPSDGYSLSGAMPSGSGVYNGLEGSRRAGSSFMAAGRDGSVGKGRRSLRDKENDLKDISKRSADAAKNSNRSVNEGSRAFLASSQNSGGMAIDGVGETVTTGSADFETPTDSNLKSIGDWGNKEDDSGKERSDDRNNLIKLLMGAFFATVVAIPLGYYLIKTGKDAKPFGWAAVIAGCAVIAAAIGVSIWAIVAAGKFAGKWGGGFLSTLTGILGGVCVAALGLTLAAAFSNSKLDKDGNETNPLRKFFNKFMPGAKKLAISQMVGQAQNMASNEINKEIQKDAQKDANKK